ncbi:hypothetical protein MKEN_00856400 [Mycena kentingensis (nom. inval.)]|nr:hypothetical protein MKEN_00856400 [Mycena kentingensis (nom. inval.)]
MALFPHSHHLPSPRIAWTATQEKTISHDYPLNVKNEASDEFLARTYFQFLWLPESIMPLGLLIPSIQRVKHEDTNSDAPHPLHAKLERLLLTARAVTNKYQRELPTILANGGGAGEEEESMMWYAVTHEKCAEDVEEPWLDDAWRTKWLERMERREVQVQILLHLLKLSLPGPSPPPYTSQSPRKKRRKLGEREPPPASLEDRLEAFMDKLSMWQLMSTLDTGLKQRHDDADRDWMQVFCAEVVEPRFSKTLAAQTALLRDKVFPHSPFSDPEGEPDEWDPPVPKPKPVVPVQRTKSTATAIARSRTNSSATLEPAATTTTTTSRSMSLARSRSRSLSVALAEDEQQQRSQSQSQPRRALTREVSMKRSFTPTVSVRDTAEAMKRAAEEKEKQKQREREEEQKRSNKERERQRVEGVTLVEATPVKARPR